MPSHENLSAAAPWVELSAGADDWASADPDVLMALFSRTQWIRSFEEYVLELASQGLIHGPAHSSIGQEGGAAGSILSLRSDDFVNGSHRGHHQFLAKAFGHVTLAKSGTLARADPRGARGAPPHAGGDLRPGRRLLPGTRRLDAPPVARGRRDGDERHRRRRGSAGGRLRLQPEALGHRRRHRHLLRRRRRQHRFGPGDLQPGRGLEAPGLLLHREQPVRRVHAHRRCHRGDAGVGPGSRLQHPELAGGRDGRAGGPPRHDRGPRPHAGGPRPHDHRGRPLPLLPPERPLPGKCVRLPGQGRGEAVAGPRPSGAAAPAARGAQPLLGGRAPGCRGRGGRGHEGDRRRAPRARPRRQARPASDHRVALAGPQLRRRRDPRRPERAVVEPLRGAGHLLRRARPSGSSSTSSPT